MTPLRLTDEQLNQVMRTAAPIPPHLRDEYLRRVASSCAARRLATARSTAPVGRRQRPSCGPCNARSTRLRRHGTSGPTSCSPRRLRRAGRSIQSRRSAPTGDERSSSGGKSSSGYMPRLAGGCGRCGPLDAELGGRLVPAMELHPFDEVVREGGEHHVHARAFPQSTSYQAAFSSPSSLAFQPPLSSMAV
jgi:hypothetical protein